MADIPLANAITVLLHHYNLSLQEPISTPFLTHLELINIVANVPEISAN